MIDTNRGRGPEVVTALHQAWIDGSLVDVCTAILHSERAHSDSELLRLVGILARPGEVVERQSEYPECPAGHPFDEENLYRHPAGYRVCRACVRESQCRYRARKRERQAA